MELLFRGRTGEPVMGDLDHVTRFEEDRYLALADPAIAVQVARRLVQLRAVERRLCALATGAQWAIGWSGFVAVDMPALTAHCARAFPRSGLAYPSALAPIYGELMPLARFAAREEENSGKAEALSAEIGIGFSVPGPSVTVPQMKSAHAAGWRYGTWFSQIDPDGDLGMHHVAHLVAITERQFRAARRDGWPAEVPRDH